jgi:hypothetical protein
MVKQIQVRSENDLAASIRELGRGAIVLLSPAVQDGERWYVTTAMDAPPGKDGFQLTQVFLGTVAPEPPLAFDWVSTAIRIGKPSDLDHREAREKTAYLVGELRRCFASVEAFETELEFVREVAMRWSGERSARLLREIEADMAA